MDNRQWTMDNDWGLQPLAPARWTLLRKVWGRSSLWQFYLRYLRENNYCGRRFRVGARNDTKQGRGWHLIKAGNQMHKMCQREPSPMTHHSGDSVSKREQQREFSSTEW